MAFTARRVATALLAVTMGLAGSSPARVSAQQDTCIGDCDRDGAVHVDELVLAVRVALGVETLGACGQLDFDGDGRVTIDELVQAVYGAVRECRALTRMTGICVEPGRTGLVGCTAGTDVDLWRCDQRDGCLQGENRTLLGATDIDEQGNFSITVESSQVESSPLLFEAQVDPPTQTTYRVMTFASLANRGAGGGARLITGIIIGPGAEAAIRLIDEIGLEAFGDDGVIAVIDAVDVAVGGANFAGATPAGAVDIALDIARNDPGVQDVIRRHVTPTVTPTHTETATPTTTPDTTRTETRTPLDTRTPFASTRTASATRTRTPTPTNTPTSTSTATPTPTATVTDTPTVTPTSLEFRVNAYTDQSQFSSDVAAIGDSRFVVVWTDASPTHEGRDGDDGGVFARRFDFPRSPIGSDFQVNTYTVREQAFPRVASNGSNSFVVVWQSVLQDGAAEGIFARRFANNGTPIGAEFQVNVFTITAQNQPDVAGGPGGGFVAVWASYAQDGNGYGVFGRRFNASAQPVGAEFQVNSHTLDRQRDPRIARDSAASFLVVWSSRLQDGDGSSVFGQRFAAGAPVGGEFQVSVATLGSQALPAVASDAPGRFLVAWRSQDAGPAPRNIVARLIDSDQGPIGGEIAIGSSPAEPDTSIAALSAGGFLVTWSDRETIFGRNVNSVGEAVGAAFQVSTFTVSAKGFPAAAAVGDGFVITWESYPQDGSYYGIYGRPFAPTP